MQGKIVPLVQAKQPPRKIVKFVTVEFVTIQELGFAYHVFPFILALYFRLHWEFPQMLAHPTYHCDSLCLREILGLFQVRSFIK